MIKDKNAENNKKTGKNKNAENMNIVKISPRDFEALRFVCFSSIVALLVYALIITNVEIGVNSIIGLVLKNEIDENGEIVTDVDGQPVRQWVINFGGDQQNNYQTGIQIPFYVFVFGLLGGYLRYLIKAFRKGRRRLYAATSGINKKGETPGEPSEGFDHLQQIYNEQKELQNLEDKNPKTYNIAQRVQYMRETLSDLAELFLAPMLAILAYFFLYQGADPNVYTISIVSFTVGLVTKDFVGRLEKFAKENVGPGVEEPRQNMGEKKHDERGAGIA